MDLALLVLRVVVGLTLSAHGAQKLFGWFGGHGIEGTGAVYDQLGLRPGKLNARVAGTAELSGGLLIALGLVTPLGAAALIAVMLDIHLTGAGWALGALGAGLLGGLSAVVHGRLESSRSADRGQAHAA